MEYLTLGFISDSFGLDGTVKVISKTQFQEKRYQKGNKVFVYFDRDKSEVELTVSSYRTSGMFDFVKFEEINTKEEADSLKSHEIRVIKNNDDLDEGYFYYSDLRGCKVLDEDKNSLGIVKEIEEFPAQITLRIGRKNEADFFVPFVKDFIINVDIKNKEIIIHLVGGML